MKRVQNLLEEKAGKCTSRSFLALPTVGLETELAEKTQYIVQ
jgi:hypothetical protein